MRIRSQFIAAAVLAGAVTLLLLAGVFRVTREVQAGLDEQAQSQNVARHVSNMLSLTNELAVYGSERAIAQWRSRHEQLAASVDAAIGHRQPPSPELLDLREKVDTLPTLFEQLARIGPVERNSLEQRRRDLMLERLMTETQEVIESRYRWTLAIGAEQQRSQRLYTAIVLGAPATLLLLVIALGVLVGRRVLAPLAQLQSVVTMIQRGDLSARCENHTPDELGDAARAVDAMVQALQERDTALQQSQQRLRLVADSLPALVAHVDADGRYTFVNAQFGRVFGVDPQAMLGRTMREVNGQAMHDAAAPNVEAALDGMTVEFEGHAVIGGRSMHYQSSFVPDRDAAGSLRGFYAMTFDITARKEAELQQAASERRLVDITDNVSALVGYIDLDHRYRFANQRYRDWLGADPRAMVGQHVRDSVGAAFYEEIRVPLEKAMAGERVRWERHATRDGRDAHYLVEYIPDFGADGRVRGCYALSIDITERRAAELATARSEQRLLELMNNIPAMVGYFDMDQRCLYANDSGLRSLGVKRADVPGITMRAALGELNYAQHEPYLNEVLKGYRSRFDGRTPFKGRDAFYQAHLIPDRAEGDAQRGFYLMTFDVTALKEAQQRQVHVERQLRAVTDNLPVLISYLDHEERYVFANRTFKDWLGIEPATLIGERAADMTAPEHYEQRREMIRRALAGERVAFDIETVTLGTARSLQNVYIPDIQSNGRVAGIYTLSSDVTALKQVEQQLSRLARVDALTGLPNRRHLEERMVEAIARASRSRKPLALMFLDVDHFKSINDSRGHGVGDAVLKEFAARLKGAIRITDMAARLAGDEFVVLLEGINAEPEAELVASKIVAAVRRPFVIDDQPLAVTTSVGVAYCARPGLESPLMECADAALYAAKEAGRNTFRVRELDPYVSDFGELRAAEDATGAGDQRSRLSHQIDAVNTVANETQAVNGTPADAATRSTGRACRV